MSRQQPALVRYIARAIVTRIGAVYDKTHWFSDRDAWTLFRLFAIGEAVGWTLLISAIVYRKFDLPANTIVVSIAGRIHGVLFALYFVFVLITARSMRWGVWRLTLALLAGMPPYTSLLFEKIMAYMRRKNPPVVAPPEMD